MRRVFHRMIDGVKTVLLFVVLIILIVLLLDHVEQKDIGVAKVIDGDSLLLNGERIRLQGIDAPERDQICERNGQDYQCGDAAYTHLRALINNNQVACTSAGRDKYDRLLAHCRAGDVDLNMRMVRDGWAVDYGGYFDVELSAKKDKLGLWAGRFEMPQAYREAKRLGEMGNVSMGLLRDLVQLAGAKFIRIRDGVVDLFYQWWGEE